MAHDAEQEAILESVNIGSHVHSTLHSPVPGVDIGNGASIGRLDGVTGSLAPSKASDMSAESDHDSSPHGCSTPSWQGPKFVAALNGHNAATGLQNGSQSAMSALWTLNRWNRDPVAFQAESRMLPESDPDCL